MTRSIAARFGRTLCGRRLRPASLTALALFAWGALPAFADDGDPDPNFGGYQPGKTLVLWDGDNATAQAVAAVAGGQLIVAGKVGPLPHLWGYVKLDPAGEPVPGFYSSFGFGGDGATETGEIHDLALDASGRTLLAGWVEVGGDARRPALARVTAGGALDGNFDGNGVKVVTTLPAGWSVTWIESAKALPDGRAVFAGHCVHCLPGDESGGFVLRTTAAGAPDPAFSGDGWLPFEIPGVDTGDPTAIEVDANDRLLIGGPGVVSATQVSYLARLTPGGAFDTGFGLVGNGVAPLAITGSSKPLDLAIDPESGRIVVALGHEDLFVSLGRLLAYTGGGNYDASFAGGTAIVDLDLEEGTRIDAVAIQSDGRVVAAGTIDANGTQAAGFFLARTLVDGTLDPSFDGNGVKRVEFDRTVDAEDRVAAATLSGGRLVAVGTARGAALADAFAVLRVESALVFADNFERGTSGGWAGE